MHKHELRLVFVIYGIFSAIAGAIGYALTESVIHTWSSLSYSAGVAGVVIYVVGLLLAAWVHQKGVRRL